MSQSQDTEPKSAKIKSTSAIRWEAILPTFIIACITVGYFHFIFDSNVKFILEKAGYSILGVEVNVSNVTSNFLNARIAIDGIDITDHDAPSKNSISIGSIKFDMSWDALLRAKILIEEVSMNDIAFGKPRSRPGKIKPPAPPEPVSTEPSALEKESNKVKKLALGKLEDKYQNNVFGDLAAVLGGQDSSAISSDLSSQLKAKPLAEQLDKNIKAKQQLWSDKLKSLPQGTEFALLGDRLKAVKLKDFGSQQELETSLKELDLIFKEADTKIKAIQAANTELNTDLADIQKQAKELEAQIKIDTQTLQTHFKIPSIDAKSLTMGVLKQYLSPWLARFNQYHELATKYVPPNLMKKADPKAVEVGIQPHPREKGTTYEFGKAQSYPLLWIKKTAISSQAGTSPYSGNIKGEIRDISSSQIATQKPLTAKIEGSFPASGIHGLYSELTVDFRKQESLILAVFKIDAMNLEQNVFVKNDDVSIGYDKAKSAINVQAKIEGLENINIQLNNQISDLSYNIAAKDAELDKAIKSVFNDIPIITVSGAITGTLPSINTNIESNIGEALRKGIEKQVQVKIDALKKQVNEQIEKEVGAKKKEIDAQIAEFKKSIESSIKKVQDAAEEQKRQANEKTDSAKKGAEDSAKKKLEAEGKKAADELKKRLGL